VGLKASLDAVAKTQIPLSAGNKTLIANYTLHEDSGAYEEESDVSIGSRWR